MAGQPCWATPGGNFSWGNRGFPVSKLGQLRGSRACLGDPGRGHLAILLALFIPVTPPCSRLLEWQKRVQAAMPSCWAASWVPPPKALPLYG